MECLFFFYICIINTSIFIYLWLYVWNETNILRKYVCMNYSIEEWRLYSIIDDNGAGDLAIEDNANFL